MNVQWGPRCEAGRALPKRKGLLDAADEGFVLGEESAMVKRRCYVYKTSLVKRQPNNAKITLLRVFLSKYFPFLALKLGKFN